MRTLIGADEPPQRPTGTWIGEPVIAPWGTAGANTTLTYLPMGSATATTSGVGHQWLQVHYGGRAATPN